MEIERKFLVKSDEWKNNVKDSVVIQQGYLAEDQDTKNVVRVRLSKWANGLTIAYLTVKGKRVGISKPEFEFQIDPSDAIKLMPLCKYTIEKVRHVIPFQKDFLCYFWEVDLFTSGPNTGLVLAELELLSEEETFPKPDWLGREVSHNDDYSNVRLAQQAACRI